MEADRARLSDVSVAVMQTILTRRSPFPALDHPRWRERLEACLFGEGDEEMRGQMQAYLIETGLRLDDVTVSLLVAHGIDPLAFTMLKPFAFATSLELLNGDGSVVALIGPSRTEVEMGRDVRYRKGADDAWLDVPRLPECVTAALRPGDEITRIVSSDELDAFDLRVSRVAGIGDRTIIELDIGAAIEGRSLHEHAGIEPEKRPRIPSATNLRDKGDDWIEAMKETTR